MTRNDLRNKNSITCRSPGCWALSPRVVTAVRDLQYAAKNRDRELGLVIPHEPEDPSGIVPVSLANQAAAFDKMSRSILSCLFSRLKRRSSSFSVLVRPSFLSPASSSACLIQFLIVCSDGSNSFARLRALLPARCSSTTCRRNSSGYSVRCLGIVNSSSTKSEVSTKPGQLQPGYFIRRCSHCAIRCHTPPGTICELRIVTEGTLLCVLPQKPQCLNRHTSGLPCYGCLSRHPLFHATAPPCGPVPVFLVKSFTWENTR